MGQKILAAASLLVLASCSQVPFLAPPSATVITAPTAGGVPSNIGVVNRSVAAAEQTLTLVMQTARGYTDLPRCGATGVRICSDPGTVRQIRSYAIQAHNALIVARANEANVELVGRLWVSIDALRTVVPVS